MSPQEIDVTAQSLGYRVLIKGRLTTKSFLHIGAGDADSLTGDAANAAAHDPEGDADGEAEDTGEHEKQGVPSLVVTGQNGKAIIPASALRGAIRSRLMRLHPGLALNLMGKAAEGKSTDPAKHGHARRIFVQTAAIVEPYSAGLECDYPSRCTDHIAMTAMSRWRRAPQDGMLRTVEAVPPGITFSVKIGICGDPAKKEVNQKEVTREEVEAVLTVLGQFDTPLHLGAFQKAGWGKVKWETSKITALTKHGLEEWLRSNPSPGLGEQGWDLCTAQLDESKFSKYIPPPDAQTHGENDLRLALTLQCESTFFTQDQRKHTKSAIKEAHSQDPEKTPEKLAKVMRIDGRAWLSGQSLKGAMRSQFERILRTKGISCCDPTLKEGTSGSSLTPERCDPIHSADELGNLCPACQVFGNGGWASTIEVTPFEETDQCTVDTRREFLAISRFTGGGVDGLKFSAEVAMRPRLTGKISVNLNRLGKAPVPGSKYSIGKDAKLGALLHLFRDFAEGDIPIGAGRSKGFGAFKALNVGQPNASEGSPFGLALHELIAKADKHKPALDCVDPNSRECIQECLSAFDQWVAGRNPDGKVEQWVLPSWWKSSPDALQPSADQPDVQTPIPLSGRYNPYHWVQVAKPVADLITSVETFGDKQAHRHDIYAGDGFSGEMTVRVKTVTPLFVGGVRKRKPSETMAGLVEHYCVGGKPAIPSTSLRGLLSTTYEIATASAMRVLEADRIYSYRVEARPGIPFNLIGRVTHDGEHIVPWNRNPNFDGHRLPANMRGLDCWDPVHQGTLTTEKLPTHFRLDYGSRHGQMPGTRHNEIQLHQPHAPFSIPIASVAVERFHRLADECTDKKENDPRPFHPLGQERGGPDKKYRLKKDDFVYFRTDNNGAKVIQIAMSQIWRCDVRESIGKKFEKEGGSEIAPYCSSRSSLTPVEKVFGFVQEDKGRAGPQPDGRQRPVAFASKLVVSDAHFCSVEGGGSPNLSQEPEVLKILSSPKPPSAAFYFGPAEGRTPTYEQIANGISTPRGRKMYLHLDTSVCGAEAMVNNSDCPLRKPAFAPRPEGGDSMPEEELCPRIHH